jgi:hypothetical protein
MRRLRFTVGARVGTALAATGMLALGSFALGGISTTAANADPNWGANQSPLVSMGSNTIEDIMDAYSGEAPSINVSGNTTPPNHLFSPLRDPTTLEQVYSYDALNPIGGSSTNVDCLNAKPGFPSMARANGSGNGRIAMSDEIDPTSVSPSGLWSAVSASCSTGHAVNIQGEIDFTRSSSAPSTTACDNSVNPLPMDNCLVYVDFAHDAVAYAYYAPGVTDAQVGTFNSSTNANGGAANPCNPADHLTTAQLTSLYSNTATAGLSIATTVPASCANGTSGSVTLKYIPCLMQPGSGTETFFTGKIGVVPATAEAAAAKANCGGTTTTSIEENGANTFETNAASALTTDGIASGAGVAIIPFSVGSFIGQENGFGFDRSSAGVAAGVNFGANDASGPGQVPYSGSITLVGSTWGAVPQNLSPNSTFYPGNYGRDLYVVLDNKKLNGSISQVNGPERRIFGFLGTNFNVSGGPQSNANSGTGAICATGTSTTFATTPPTISGPAQSYLPLFGFTPTTTCGAETIVPITPGAGS